MTSDVIIVGAGLIGSSIAYHLSQRKEAGLSIVVLDCDLSGTYSSSELNAGGIRATWWHEVNIELSKATRDFLQVNPDQFGFRQKGYLWLHGEKGWNGYLSHKPLYRKMKLDIEEVPPEDLSMRLPYIDRLDGVYGVTYTFRDGIFNPNLLKQFYREKSKSNGVTFIDGAYVTKIEKTEKGVIIHTDDIRDSQGKPNREDIFERLSERKGAFASEKRVFKSIFLVNAAGAWASKLAKLYGHEVPSQPVRRQVSIFDCQKMDLTPYGMIVDTSGVYFHAEAGHVLAGYATPDEPTGFNFKYDGDSFFETYIWPNLMKRMSLAEALKHVTGWAGLYEQTPDRSGILGKVDPDHEIYESHSFTGRGAMQSFGVGLATSELLIDRRFKSINCEGLHPDRFRLPSAKLLYEGFHI